MIRKKHYISGRGTRYFKHNAGIVRENRSMFITMFLPFLVVLGLFGSGGYFGYQYYQNSEPLKFASENTQTQNNPIDSEESDFALAPFQAKEDEELTSKIKDAVDDMPSGSKWSVSVRDLNSSRMANVNADKKTDPAGLFKLFMLPSLDKRLSADYWESFIDYGHSVNECVLIMISQDDDACVNSFGYYIGWDSYNEYNNELSFNDTKLTQELANTSTSREISEMMYRLQNSLILSDKARRVAFDAFYEQENPNGVRNICGADCLVGSLVSERGEYKHEVAVVTNGEAQYVVTILSEGASWDEFQELASKIDVEMTP